MTEWHVGQKIGSGGFGDVYEARRSDDGEPFAIKQLSGELSADAEAVARFRREVAIQQMLDHPNVLPVVATDLKAEPPWFAMPRAAGSLLDRIEAGLTEDETDTLFAGVLAGVAHAHSKGVIHRDLKPENVLMTADGTPQLSDFGLGKNLLSDSRTLTRTAIGAGSMVYGAPEQMRDLAKADARADVYAVGKILQALLLRELPVIHDDERISRKYRYFIAKCTEQRVEDRYQTIDDVVSAFEQVTRGVEKPEAPREEFDRIVLEWTALSPGEDTAALEKLHALLERHSDNQAFFQEKVPKIPPEMLAAYVQVRPADFRRMLGDYDHHVMGGLDFAYCDVLANFYRRIYELTADLGVKRVVLVRLIEMGAAHTRFYVGGVVAAILRSIREVDEAMMANEVLRADLKSTRWFASYVADVPLVNPIADAFKAAEQHH